MDFTFTEEQETISKLARELFERRATPERLTELEADESCYDAALWKELASVDLLGTALPESVGGSCVSGGGFLELGVLLAEVGWSVAVVAGFAGSERPGSCKPALRMRVPSMTPGRKRRCCSGVPCRAIGSAPSSSVG